VFPSTQPAVQLVGGVRGPHGLAPGRLCVRDRSATPTAGRAAPSLGRCSARAGRGTTPLGLITRVQRGLNITATIRGFQEFTVGYFLKHINC